MCLRYSTNIVGNRLASHVISLTPIGAPAGASFISAINDLCGCRQGRREQCERRVPRLRQAFLLSSPISSRVSDRYMCGGTSRLSGAGLFLYTRPARSKVEPWQGQRKPPSQVSGSEGCGPACSLSLGEQPRCEQMPTATKYSGLIERYSLWAYGGIG